MGHRGSYFDLSLKFLSMFSSRCFIVSSLTFKCLIHFKFIFVYGINTEKAMATHSSVLAWRIPGKEEPGGLLSMGSHRVRYD